MDAQIQHLEKRVDEFVNTVHKRLDENNNKLDLLIDLTRQMAVLQEKQDHNSQDIKNLGSKFREKDVELSDELKKIELLIAKSDAERAKAIERLHKRIDEVEDEAEKSHNEISLESNQFGETLKNEIGTYKGKLDSLNEDYKGKVNFFRGIFFAFAMFSAVGQGMLYKYFADIEKGIAETKVAVQKVENRINEIERQTDIIQANLRNMRK